VYSSENIIFVYTKLRLLLPPTKEEVCVLPMCVCLLARLLKNTWTYLDEILHVDRCQDMDELNNFSSLIQIIVRIPEPDCFLRYRISYGTLQPCLHCQRAALLRGILHRGKSHCRPARPSHGFKMVLLTEPSDNDLCRR